MTYRILIKTLAICVALAAASANAAAIAVPQVTTKASASSHPHPYNESADAHADVAEAIARAKASGKHILLDFGGNWCPDCRMLAAVLDLKEVKPAVAQIFEVAMIDVGRFNKNLDIAKRYGVDVKAVPLVIVLDSDGRVINAGNPTALSNAHSMSGQAIVDTIFGWVRDAQ
jgi:thioredoxin 1